MWVVSFAVSEGDVVLMGTFSERLEAKRFGERVARRQGYEGELSWHDGDETFWFEEPGTGGGFFITQPVSRLTHEGKKIHIDISRPLFEKVFDLMEEEECQTA